MKFITCLVFLLITSSAFSQTVPPSKDFITLKADTFDLIVDAKHQAEGEFYLHKLLQASAFTKNYFSIVPGKTVVIINDRTDLTNGYATKIPYSHIMLFPVLPGPMESLGEPGDWALELLTHEYTHVLNMEPATGVFRYLRPVFGSIMSPNLLLPTWWKEGLAVELETAVANGGRTRSAYQEGMIRSWLLDDSFYDYNIATANEALPTWPQGQRPYIFGSIFWSQTVADKNKTVVKDLNNRHGARVPYFIETPANEIIGRRYEQQYARALRETELRGQKQIEKLKSVSPTTDELINIEDSVVAQMPTFSADGQYMAIITKNDIEQRRLRVFERNAETKNFQNPKEVPLKIVQDEEPEDKKVFDGPPSGTMSRSFWMHSKPVLIFDRVDAFNPTESYSDLYSLDIANLKVKRLTRGLRAREAGVSPDDSKLAFVQLGLGVTSLAILDLKTSKVDVLMTGPMQYRIAFPTFLDAKRILFSVSTPDGKENFEVYNLETKMTTPVKNFPAGRNRITSLSKDGLFFISNANGVNNVYQSNTSLDKAVPVTHGLTGYLSANTDPITGDLYATKMTSTGPQLVRVEKSKWKSTPKDLPKVDSMFADRYPNHEPLADIDLQKAGMTVQPYSAWGYLWPRYWIPFVDFTENGWSASVLTSGHDPLSRHTYSLNVGWENEINKMSWDVSYLNASFNWPFFVQTVRSNTYLIDKTSFQTSNSVALGTQQRIFSIHKDFVLGAGVISQGFEVPGNEYDRKGAFVQSTYGKLTQAGMQISPESDRSFFARVTHYPVTTKFPVHTQTSASANMYFSSWLPERHSLMMKLSGMYTQQRISSSFGASSITYSTVADSVAPQFLMRGYLTGHFIGKTALSPQVEYRFPLREINRGSGTDPFFIRRLHGALVHDGMMVDGFVYRKASLGYVRDQFNGYYSNLGAELRLDTVVGYVLPIKFVVGHYVPLDMAVGGDSQTAFSLQINQFF